MTTTEAAAPRRRKRTKPSFLEKTLAGITAGIESAVFSEENARRDGFLQRRDPRVKLVSFIALIVVTGLSRALPVLLALFALVMIAAAVSAIDLRLFLKRVWLGIPLFSGIVVLPSIFFVGSHVLFHIPLGLFTLEVHRDGLFAALVFVVRVGVSVSLAILLILSTKWADILKSLRFLRVPGVFVLILAMTYRYIFLFLHSANAMFLARKSRIVARTSGNEQRWWIVATMSTLMSRSMRMGDDVYRAMLARGFDSRMETLTDYHMRTADWLLGAASIVVAVAAFFADRSLR
jgi:cobalt ECF transporter T component CbiQ